jgi:hypothetical protein
MRILLRSGFEQAFLVMARGAVNRDDLISGQNDLPVRKTLQAFAEYLEIADCAGNIVFQKHDTIAFDGRAIEKDEIDILIAATTLAQPRASVSAILKLPHVHLL